VVGKILVVGVGMGGCWSEFSSQSKIE